jgi:ankyrin repeat protein
MQHQYGRRPANLIESFKIWWRQHKGEQFYPHVVPQTAIVMALNSRRGRPDEAGILRVLLARGADVNAYDNAAKTPLMSFAEELRTCDDMTPEQGKQDLIFLDVLLHAALDLQDKDGNTALMCAAADGNLAEVRSLLKAGANPDLRNRAGKTAYDQAVELEQDDVVKVLRRTKYKR